LTNSIRNPAEIIPTKLLTSLAPRSHPFREIGLVPV